ncbi:MAG: LuxR family transcriptional regulator [Sulfuricella sp.]|nr:LuxR family transcriptional regulator [Sulfuricella sp.]
MDLYLCEDILKAENQDDLLVKTQRVVEYIGYETFVYYFSKGVKAKTKVKVEPDIFFFGTMPERWYQQYANQKYEAIDPAFLHCAKSSVPIVWTHKLFTAPKIIDMHHESVELGVSGGATFSIPRNGRAGVGVFSLARAQDTDKAAPFARKTLGDGMFLVAQVDTAMQRIASSTSSKSLPTIKLTPREYDCLLYAAHGNSYADIAAIICRSHDNVVFHLGNAKEKLGAANITEAVAIAMSRGLIVP